MADKEKGADNKTIRDGVRTRPPRRRRTAPPPAEEDLPPPRMETFEPKAPVTGRKGISDTLLGTLE